MAFGRKTTETEVTIVVNQDEVDLAVAKVESAITKMEVAARELRQVVQDAKRARAELESSIARSKKRGQGGW